MAIGHTSSVHRHQRRPTTYMYVYIYIYIHTRAGVFFFIFLLHNFANGVRRDTICFIHRGRAMFSVHVFRIRPIPILFQRKKNKEKTRRLPSSSPANRNQIRLKVRYWKTSFPVPGETDRPAVYLVEIRKMLSLPQSYFDYSRSRGRFVEESSVIIACIT